MVIDDVYVTHVQGTGIQETMQGFEVIKFLDLGLVEALSKLAPHGIEHHFGQGAQTRVVFDLGVLQLDAFMLEVLAEVLLSFGFIVPHPGCPSTGFLFDFQPSVDVVSEETLTSLVKLPDLVDVLDVVSQVHRFGQFRAAPCPGQGALLVRVMAFGSSLPRTLVHFFFDISSTEWREEFPTMAVRQYWMVQFTRGEDSATDQAKVLTDVRVTRVGDEARMPFGVHAGLVHPRVQGSDIDVMDLLTRSHAMVQFHGIGTTPAEGVTGVERFCEGKGLHERSDVRRGVFKAAPFTFPHLHHIVPQGLKQADALLGSLVDILHGPITVAYMGFATVGITVGTPMPETAMKFVHRLGVVAVPIHEEAYARDTHLTGIARVLNVRGWSVWVDVGHETVVRCLTFRAELVHEGPFQIVRCCSRLAPNG